MWHGGTMKPPPLQFFWYKIAQLPYFVISFTGTSKQSLSPADWISYIPPGWPLDSHEMGPNNLHWNKRVFPTLSCCIPLWAPQIIFLCGPRKKQQKSPFPPLPTLLHLWIQPHLCKCDCFTIYGLRQILVFLFASPRKPLVKGAKFWAVLTSYYRPPPRSWI